ncbi:MAG TPA: CHAD domain-containing protein [Methanomicrobiales archaeon]|nr:CHAD domain-containing protein [Methanomicrobiales archaeon]
MPGFPGETDGERTCSYGTGYLLKQVSAVRKEIPGVLAGDDIEHIHRMRVATRRLRSALPLFSPCFPGKKIRRWRRGLRGIARALGEARDADIQITFLTGYLDSLKSGRGAADRAMLPAVIPPPGSYPVQVHREWTYPSLALRNLARSIRTIFTSAGGYLERIFRHGESAGERTGAPVEPLIRMQDLVPGTECLLLRKNQERAALQEDIGKAIRRLEKSGLLGELERDLRRSGKRAQGSWPDGLEIFAMAFTSVSTRIDGILAFGEALADPARTAEHHAMRIAVKRLRYTLEVWRDLFGDELGDEIDTLKRLQDLLGDLHDCDVWIGILPGFLMAEGNRCRAFFGDESHFRGLVPGIEALMADRGDERRRLHETCLTLWRDLAYRGFWEGLRERLILPLSGPREGSIRIGLLANIQGDHEALARVLADGRSRGAGLFLNAGDTLGSGRGSGETVEMIRREGIVSVAGDCDLEILDGIPPPAPSRGPGEKRDQGRPPKAARRFIRALPASLRLFLGGRRLLLAHGSPGSLTETLDADTPGERLCQIAREARVEAIVSGGSHLPSLRNACQVLFVNPGSVGRPEGTAAPPSYAILEIAPDGMMAVAHHEPGSGPAGPFQGVSPVLRGAPVRVPEHRVETRDGTGD